MVAKYDYSNESSANRLMSDDFPTEVSPTNTTLYMKSDICVNYCESRLRK